jgi:hypothetical protein
MGLREWLRVISPVYTQPSCDRTSMTAYAPDMYPALYTVTDPPCCRPERGVAFERF